MIKNLYMWSTERLTIGDYEDFPHNFSNHNFQHNKDLKRYSILLLKKKPVYGSPQGTSFYYAAFALLCLLLSTYPLAAELHDTQDHKSPQNNFRLEINELFRDPNDNLENYSTGFEKETLEGFESEVEAFSDYMCDESQGDSSSDSFSNFYGSEVPVMSLSEFMGFPSNASQPAEPSSTAPLKQFRTGLPQENLEFSTGPSDPKQMKLIMTIDNDSCEAVKSDERDEWEVGNSKGAVQCSTMSKIRGGQLKSPNRLRPGHSYVDIAEYLSMAQAKAANKLHLPPSSMSKRWKESVGPNRKWPYRILCKIDKEITVLLHNIPPGTAPPRELGERLDDLMRQREYQLRPASIRIT